MPTNTRPLPSRDPLDRTMARASSLVWPRAVHPRPFCDRHQNQPIKRRLQKTITALTREIRKDPEGWSIDSLPYSEKFERLVTKHYGSSGCMSEVFLTAYLTALKMRKTGELPTRKDALKTRHKTKTRGKSKSRAR